MRQTKTINQTFSIPVEIAQELHLYVKNRQVSRFVSDAIRKELELQKQNLRDAYISANDDDGQIEASIDWTITLADGENDW